MVTEIIKSEVEVEYEDGPMRIRTLANGGLQVRGPTKFLEDSEPHITIRLSHEDDPVEYGDGATSETGDWAQASTHLTRDEAEELYDALGDVLESEPSTLFDDMEFDEE